MSNPHPSFRIPKADTEEGRDFHDKRVDTRMRNTVLRQWAIRRNFLEIVFNSKKEKTQLQLMEQLDGKPKQEIETTLSTATPISLEMFGDSAPKENQ